MVSLDGRAYNDLPAAWRYRKEFVKGCSCNQTDYDPTLLAQSDNQGTGAAPAANSTPGNLTPQGQTQSAPGFTQPR